MEILTAVFGFVLIMMYLTNKSLTSERNFYKAECVKRMRYKSDLAAENELARLYDLSRRSK